jgi:hypothetical protein
MPEDAFFTIDVCQLRGGKHNPAQPLHHGGFGFNGGLRHRRLPFKLVRVHCGRFGSDQALNAAHERILHPRPEGEMRFGIGKILGLVQMLFAVCFRHLCELETLRKTHIVFHIKLILVKLNLILRPHNDFQKQQHSEVLREPTANHLPR